MSDDLFDLAKPVRDASIVEIDRVLGEQVQEAVRAGNLLGAHFTSVCMAFTSRRFEVLTGPVNDPIQDILSIALANLFTHAAIAARPMAGGTPISPSMSGVVLFQKVAHYAFEMLAHHEAGLNDFVIPFERNADGSLEPRRFDVLDMLKGQPE
jgi:hypothetical protein